jgi:Fur family ferric uptake transcriptional regulator
MIAIYQNDQISFANELQIHYRTTMLKQGINRQETLTLKQAGLQKTAQRLAVLGVLNRAEAPLTAGDVQLQLAADHKVNRVTIYRILASYTQKGLIRQFESKRGVHYYERVEPGKQPHPHFNCRGCGEMFCMPSASELWGKLAEQPDFEIESISISGLCNGCRSNGKGYLRHEDGNRNRGV